MFISVNYSIEILRLLSVVLLTLTHTKHSITGAVPYFFVETLPTYGTSLLSIISGFLYMEYSSRGPDLLKKKVRTLVVPYLISNLLVLSMVCIMYLFGYDFLNRLSFDVNIILDGLLAFGSEPVNPPTYFIRDIFLIFCVISVLRGNYLAIIFIAPYLAFGQLFLRPDVVFLFFCGVILSRFRDSFEAHANRVVGLLLLSVATALLYDWIWILKFLICIMIFFLSYRIRVRFFRVGGLSYLLHLYHAPVIVVLHPLVSRFAVSELMGVAIQFTLTVSIVCVAHLLLKRLNVTFLTGGRS